MNDEVTFPPHRRAADLRIETLVTDVADLKRDLAENNKTTSEVRDILVTFKTLGTIAKWVAAIAGAIAAVVAAIKSGSPGGS